MAHRIIQVVLDKTATFDSKGRFWRLALFEENGQSASFGMSWEGIWVAGEYPKNAVVKHNDQLWVAEVATDLEPGTLPEDGPYPFLNSSTGQPGVALPYTGPYVSDGVNSMYFDTTGEGDVDVRRISGVGEIEIRHVDAPFTPDKTAGRWGSTADGNAWYGNVPVSNGTPRIIIVAPNGVEIEARAEGGAEIVVAEEVVVPWTELT